MIDSSQIPPEVVEVAAIAAYEAYQNEHPNGLFSGISWDKLDEETHSRCRDTFRAEARAAIAAALAAWPGAYVIDPDDDDAGYHPRMLLPLPWVQKARDE